jgi:beta-glucosidase
MSNRMTVELSHFPADFVWGTATASYQIEGATREDGRGPSIWDTFAATPGAIIDGATGDVACDHFHRYAEDVKLMADLGVNSYRFSIAWPRIQATGAGPANPPGLDFYRRLSESLLEHDITPYATLYHWDLPQALEDEGGWLNRDTAYRFAEYSGLVAESLGDVIDDWITLNEPWCSSFLGYASGHHAPGKKLGTQAAHAAHHLLLGHGLATQAVRAARPDATIGVTLNLYSVRPATESDADADAVRRIDGLQNRLFLDPLLLGAYPADVLDDLGETEWFAANPESDAATIAAPIDFLGVNYYSRHTVSGGPADSNDARTTDASGIESTALASSNPGSETVRFVDTGTPQTQMGWPIVPEGLVDVLRMVNDRRPGLRTFITENGSAYPDVPDADGYVDDVERLDYLQAHLAACADAISQGLPLAGYFGWSLMDNFEWAWGFTRRFGLAYVDYETQKRTVKKSGSWFSELLSQRAASAQTSTNG